MKRLYTFLFLLFSLSYSHAQNYRWAYGFGGPTYDAQGTSIATDAQANVYVAGFYGDSIDFDPGAGTAIIAPGNFSFGQSLFVAKYDSAGHFIWAFNIDGYDNWANPSIAVNTTGLYITGTFDGTPDFDPSPAVATLSSTTSANIFLAKYDLNGNYIWAKSMGGPNTDVANSIAIDNIGNSYITGYFRDTADFDPGVGVAILVSDTLTDTFFAKYDSSGNFVWAHDLCDANGASSGGRSVALDKSSNEIYITGSFRGTVDFDRGPGVFNITDTIGGTWYVAKYDTSGSFIWAGSLSAAMGIGILDICVNDAVNNDFYICGFFWGVADFDLSNGIFSVNPNNNYDVIYFAKYTSNGNLIWVKQTTSTSNLGWGKRILTDNNGNVYLSGFFSGITDFDPGLGTANLISNGGNDIFFAKYDSLGNYIWARNIGGQYDDRPNSIALDASDNLYITGYYNYLMDADPGSGIAMLPLATNQNIFIGKYDNTLTQISTIDVSGNNELSVFPNPSDDFIRVYFSMNCANCSYSLEITDIAGRTVYDKNISANERINVSCFAPGLYSLSLTCSSKILRTNFVKINS